MATRPARARTLDWTRLDGHPKGVEIGDSVLDRAIPREAQVAVARLHGQPCHLGRRHARTVHVELLVSQPR